MQITVRFFAQVKAAAGESQRVLEVSEDACVEDVVRQAATSGSAELRRLLVDNRGSIHKEILLFVGEDCVPRDGCRPLRDGDIVDIMSPISGG